MSKTQKSPEEIAAYYAEIERRHPEQRHTLGDRPQPPLQLLRCKRCAASPCAVFTRYAYGLPAYKVQCEQCGSQSKPQMWGVGKMFAEIPHTVTEAEALADACELWNASQIGAAPRTVRTMTEEERKTQIDRIIVKLRQLSLVTPEKGGAGNE